MTKTKQNNTATNYLPSIRASEIEAIVSAQYSDIFSVLGLHNNTEGKGLVLRALVPGAEKIELIAKASKRKINTLKSIHPDGLFEVILSGRKNHFEYLLRVSFPDMVVDMEDPYRFPPCLSNDDLYLFGEGTQERSYQWMGAHAREVNGVQGVLFVIWAPSARRVSVVGDFNSWNGRQHLMRKHPASGVWEIFIPNLLEYAAYKYEIIDANGHCLPLKADPYALSMQHPPQTASRLVLNESYDWQDSSWMSERPELKSTENPVSIYEVHVGSWQRVSEEGNRYLSYRELSEKLIPYVIEMGFTHIQLMPISEYPFDGSWGYQPVGLFSPTIRHGTPDEFKAFIDCCHQQNIGVLLDWVPGHFPTDEYGLGNFDGSCLYEHKDLRKGFHPDWNTLIYNYSRGEVISYLLSNANYWLDQFHIDGLRVDAVASMLYLDYSREEGEWIPNENGGRENLEAIQLLQNVNSRVYFNNPGIMMIAEESTSWPGVSRSVESGGLGFGYKWNMGWMNDTLRYMKREPIHRKYHHNEMTFGIAYAFSENFVLPLSHDEVVHGKGALLSKMPGNEWEQFANLRAYFGFMWGHPGKKLLFMGCEFGQPNEWNHDQSLDWHLLEQDNKHRGLQNLVRDLNLTYRSIPALHQMDCESSGFEWVQVDNEQQSIFAWLRKGQQNDSIALVVVNMTPESYTSYQVGVPRPGRYKEYLNTNSELYGGDNLGNYGAVEAIAEPFNGQTFSMRITLPPLTALIFEWEPE